MKAVLMTAPGGLDVLKLVAVERPARPGPQQLLIRVRAAGVNPLDTKIRKQHFFYPDNLPAILGGRRRRRRRTGGSFSQAIPSRRRSLFFWQWTGARAGCVRRIHVSQ